MPNTEVLVISSRRWGYIVLLLLSAGFAAVCVSMLLVFFDRSSPFVSDYLLFLGLLVLSFWGATSALRRVRHPPELRITQKGITLTVAGQERAWSWREIEEVDVVIVPSARFPTRHVALTIRLDQRLQPTRRVNLAYPFRKNPEALRDLILEARSGSFQHSLLDIADRSN